MLGTTKGYTMPVLTNAKHVTRWSVRCVVDGRESRFQADTHEEALEVARSFTNAFGPAATAQVIRAERITTAP
jgi:hypothetical protein